ncbi:MAG: methyltransferase FkbM [Pseudomonadales bacterium]|nr:methyltransferase FkbM [Pseudomonadales bacterium]
MRYYLTRAKKILYLFTDFRALTYFLKFRVLPTIEHHYVLSILPNTVIDIGANKGQFALAVELFTAAKVISFEPLTHAAITCKEMFDNNDRHTIINAAIAPQSGRLNLHVSKSDDSSSLLEIGPNQTNLFPGTQEVRQETVTCGPLSEFITKEDLHGTVLLKIDVQGYELEALKGCSELLSEIDIIYCECSFIELYKDQCSIKELMAFLDSWGYEIAGVYNTLYSKAGRAIQSDFLFVRSS